MITRITKPLSPRENQIAELVYQCLTDHGIANNLNLTEPYIRRTLVTIYKKLCIPESMNKRCYLVRWWMGGADKKRGLS